jgi:predicted nucleic acid-binding protein
VDWTSFLFMRREGIEVAFAVDQDFVAQGFRVTPGPSDHNFGG